MTPFLDIHNDVNGLYLTELDGKWVLADEDAFPDMVVYTTKTTKAAILEYVAKNSLNSNYSEPQVPAFHKDLPNSAYYFQPRTQKNLSFNIDFYL